MIGKPCQICKNPLAVNTAGLFLCHKCGNRGRQEKTPPTEWTNIKGLLTSHYGEEPTRNECISFGCFLRSKMPMDLKRKRRSHKDSPTYGPVHVAWIQKNIHRWEETKKKKEKSNE